MKDVLNKGKELVKRLLGIVCCIAFPFLLGYILIEPVFKLKAIPLSLAFFLFCLTSLYLSFYENSFAIKCRNRIKQHYMILFALIIFAILIVGYLFYKNIIPFERIIVLVAAIMTLMIPLGIKKILYVLFIFLASFIIIEPRILSNLFPYGIALLFFCLTSIALASSKEDEITLKLRNGITGHYKVLIAISSIVLLVIVALIVNDKLPYDLTCFVLSAVVILFSIPLGNRSNNNNFFIFLGVFILACINWTFVSYFSYYNGVTQNLKEEGKILQTATYEIIKADNLDTKQKEKLLNNIYKESRGEITLTKNDKLYQKGGRGRNRKEYKLETHGDSLPFDYDNNSYHVLFEYGNRPFFMTGILRAITFSTMPDWLDYRRINPGNFSIEGFKQYFNKIDNEGYFTYGAYRRSTNLWVPFWVLYFIFLVLFYYVARLDESQQKLIEASEKFNISEAQLQSMIENRAEIYQLMAAEMQQEMRNITTSQAKNTLQKMVSNWADKKRTVLSRKEYEHGLSAAETAAHDTRHILINKWTSNEFYQEYPDDVKVYINEILEDLKEIPNVISVKMEDVPIKRITESIEAQYNKFPKDPQVEFSYSDETSGMFSDKVCRVNLHRINSIVFNLLSNSVKVTDKFRKNYLDEHDEDDDDFEEFTRMINLNVRVINEENKPFLSICVKDNGGGFSDKIIDKIYKEQIMSEFRSKGMTDQHRSEMGEGTAYIGFFVDMMGGKIKAANYPVSDSFMGARTEILLPIKEEKSQEE